MKAIFVAVMLFAGIYGCIIRGSKPDHVSTVCNFSDKKPLLLGRHAPKAAGEVQRATAEVLGVIGFAPNFIVREGDSKLASALVVGAERYIIYNKAFYLSALETSGHKWAAYGVIAHEVAHHLLGHTFLPIDGDPKLLELEADEWAAVALYKLGASKDEATSAARLLTSEIATATHPAREDRVAAMQKGWMREEARKPSPAIRIDPPADCGPHDFVRLPPMDKLAPGLVVQARCIELANVEIHSVHRKTPMNLTIIATQELRFGDKSSIDFSGVVGEPGTDKSGARTYYPHCPGEQCLCPQVVDGADRLWGGRGGAGYRGGNIVIVARKITLPEAGSTGSTLSLNVRGGNGGAPGESGYQQCGPDSCRKDSARCPGPDTKQGSVGPDGAVIIRLGDSNGFDVLDKLREFVVGGTPQAFDARLVATEEGFLGAIQEYRAAASTFHLHPGSKPPVATLPPFQAPEFRAFDDSSEYRIYSDPTVPATNLRVSVRNEHLSDGVRFEVWKDARGNTTPLEVPGGSSKTTTVAKHSVERLVWVGHFTLMLNMPIADSNGWAIDFVRKK